MTHVPTKELRTVVLNLAGDGVPIAKIAGVIGIGKTSMHKYYQRELDVAVVDKIRAVSTSLYESAIEGNVTAMIFWLKCQAFWKEPKDEVEEVDKQDEVGKIQIEMITSKPEDTKDE